MADNHELAALARRLEVATTRLGAEISRSIALEALAADQKATLVDLTAQLETGIKLAKGLDTDPDDGMSTVVVPLDALNDLIDWAQSITG